MFERFEEITASPWYGSNRTENCTCKEYTKKTSVLVLVNENCPKHGCQKIVDSSTQTTDNCISGT